MPGSQGRPLEAPGTDAGRQRGVQGHLCAWGRALDLGGWVPIWAPCYQLQHPGQAVRPLRASVAFSCSVQVDDIPGVLVDPLLILVEHVHLHCPSGVSQSAAKF